MDPELPLRCKDGRPPVGVTVPLDEMDALRRSVRLVWTSETLVGVVGRAFRAAAAAAEDRDLGTFDSRRLKAESAAVAALGFAVADDKGCIAMSCVSTRLMKRCADRTAHVRSIDNKRFLVRYANDNAV